MSRRWKLRYAPLLTPLHNDELANRYTKSSYVGYRELCANYDLSTTLIMSGKLPTPAIREKMVQEYKSQCINESLLRTPTVFLFQMRNGRTLNQDVSMIHHRSC
jgi:hypothetical protein